jgi:hypothetical protein
MDKFDARGTSYQKTSDANGLFSISGIRGAVLTVGVWKDGYQVIDDQSTGAFAYGTPPDSTRRFPPTVENPAIFVLHKMGRTEPLIKSSSGQVDIPKNGEIVRVDFRTGRSTAGALQIQSWIGDTHARKYDWSYRLSIPRGGLIERADPFDCEAPADGYQSSSDTIMMASSDIWSSSHSRSYFAQFPDGTYARFLIKFYPGSRNFVVLESYLNPTPGHRNLEFDPAKEVRQP